MVRLGRVHRQFAHLVHFELRTVALAWPPRMATLGDPGTQPIMTAKSRPCGDNGNLSAAREDPASTRFSPPQPLVRFLVTCLPHTTGALRFDGAVQPRATGTGLGLGLELEVDPSSTCDRWRAGSFSTPTTRLEASQTANDALDTSLTESTVAN